MNFFKNLFEHNRYLKMTGLYLGSSMGVMHFTEMVFPAIHLPEWSVTLVIVLALLGLPVTLFMTWALNRSPVTADGAATTRIAPLNWIKVFMAFALCLLFILGTILLYSNLIYKPHLFNSQLTAKELFEIDTLRGQEQDAFLVKKGFTLRSSEHNTKSFVKVNETEDKSKPPLEKLDIKPDDVSIEYTTTDHQHYQQLSEELGKELKFMGEEPNENGTTVKNFEGKDIAASTKVALVNDQSSYVITVGQTSGNGIPNKMLIRKLITDYESGLYTKSPIILLDPCGPGRSIKIPKKFVNTTVIVPVSYTLGPFEKAQKALDNIAQEGILTLEKTKEQPYWETPNKCLLIKEYNVTVTEAGQKYLIGQDGDSYIFSLTDLNKMNIIKAVTPNGENFAVTYQLGFTPIHKVLNKFCQLESNNLLFTDTDTLGLVCKKVNGKWMPAY